MHRIDVHTHILPPPAQWPDLSERFGYAGWIALEEVASNGAGGCGCARMLRVEQAPDGRTAIGADGRRKTTFFREIGSNCWDPAVRVADMQAWPSDAATPMVQALSTVPVMFGYWARPQDTLGLARWLNDHIAGVCRERPDRFLGLGTVPMNAPDLAVRELERCVRDLGMVGVQIGSNVNGRNLDEREFDEVWAAAASLGACVFVHPWEMLCGQRGGGEPGRPPSPPLMSERLARHWGAWLVGMPAETCLAVTSVLMGGILEHNPTLRIGFAHGGGSFPGTIGRIEHGYRARPDLCATETARSPRQWCRVGERPAKFWVDSLVHDPAMLRLLADLMGPSRVMLGSDYPFPLGEDVPGSLIDEIASGEVRRSMLADAAIEFLGPGAARFAARTRP